MKTTKSDASRTEKRAKAAAPVLVDERLLPKRFVMVSNRLPYRLSLDDGKVRLERGIGGLVTALDPIMRFSGGSWIGWTGNYRDRLPDSIQVDGEDGRGGRYHLRPINLTREEVEQYYLGYANKSLWPLLHYFQEHCEFDRQQWAAYKSANQKFAEAIVDDYRDGDLIWIHDYHLMLVPAMVRRALPRAKIAFFLHIPFPSEAVWTVEPHAAELLEGVLGADLVGFHLDSYARDFLDAVTELTDHDRTGDGKTLRVGERKVRVGSYPISIDFRHFSDLAARDEVTRKVERLRDGYRAEILAVGVDRLDYTKGILERLRAVELLLDRYPEIQGKFTFIQISAPSRTKVEVYREMRKEIERMVGHVNGRFGARGCIPIDYRYESEPQEDLVAYYRASDLALVTPLRDGMNLVAKEYVASQVHDGGALVLSRFAGAYDELKEAFIVNPYDAETVADRIHEVIHTPAEERQRRMRAMRENVRRNDIYWWLERYLRDVV